VPRPAPFRILKASVFVASDALRGRLGADPIAAALNRLGFWALTFLLCSLLATPLNAFLGWTAPVRVRRMVGLFAFYYASLHFVTYFAIDQFFDLHAIVEDVVKRKFITIGFLAFLMLIPLAVTSTNGWVRRLGFVRWKRIHRMSYAAAVLGVIHFIWRVKADLRQPLLFAAALAVLLLARVLGGVLAVSRGGANPGTTRAETPGGEILGS
jgi:sulfoxide reductase heme-binding subunit YedZ